MPSRKRSTRRRTKISPKRSLRRPPDCRNFSGYKPCFPGTTCVEECRDPRPYGTRILLINLEAMGNVLVATTLLQPMRRKYPKSTIAWITLASSAPLLQNNPLVDQVYRWSPEAWMELQGREFDIVMNIDKSVHTGAFLKTLRTRKTLGYGTNPNGVIVPLNKEAEYNYRLGLDDDLKFRRNQKSSSQLLAEALGLKYQRDEYILNLSPGEEEYCRTYKHEAGITAPLVVGLNTGCSLLYPNKKMTVDQHVVLVEELSKRKELQILLLGGPEDTERNAEIARQTEGKCISTPTTEGVRRGLCYVNLCDVVISGDSFGMHAAIGLRKHVIVWFGVSCPQEIDLFGRGVKLLPEGLVCSPCWKRTCPYNLECIQMIDLDRIVGEVDACLETRRKK